jgi:hypothetical protein
VGDPGFAQRHRFVISLAFAPMLVLAIVLSKVSLVAAVPAFIAAAALFGWRMVMPVRRGRALGEGLRSVSDTDAR